MNKKIFGLALIILLVGIVVINIIQDVREKNEVEAAKEKFSQSENLEQADEGLKEGEVPPDFELETLDGNSVKLSDYRGQKVMLNFWASWCPPCKAEMPHIENYYKTKAKQENVEILAVNLTSVERGVNARKKVKKFIEEYGLTFPVPLDESGKLGKTYQAFTIPTTYMIDTNGMVHTRIIGPMDEETIEKIVSEMK
ncbi:thiol:disulfide interchange protein tlpA [Siminovitchia terrae]|uniref:TlpA family protein disulfide reductase n=1 Tax=Siminovitchia terrae TaxID=1914933 RepID=A0A429XCV8_SIMTE|nr:TlpA disulfide reductase family protein [Siminovitchia terrae]RST61260.1 TlpA family protein disulfide reductase [Siminovitchia terrae]GIN89234.1 thiol:disulfide interchange protein tlpA [Siminovitchia terrae]